MSAYCVFNIGDRRVGIPMPSVREILEPDRIAATPLPLAPRFVRGLFNLRGQVFPALDLTDFVGANPTSSSTANVQAVIVERGDFRFGTLGHRIDTLEAEEENLEPLGNAALFPALDAEARTPRGKFQIIHLDRLEACLKQAFKFAEPKEPVPTAAPGSQTAPSTQE